MELVLIRHGESVWNKLNQFTGWTDVGLTEKGAEEAKEGAILLKKERFDFDVCYTSYLKRAIHTLNIVLEELDREWLPVHKSWRLNERHYGALQGLNKKETAESVGADKVKMWRRSFNVQPPALGKKDDRNPQNQEAYRDVDPTELPLTESLKDTIARALPYFNEHIKKDMIAGKRVLIVAHGNSIRALVKHFDNLSDEEIVGVNIPTGVPLVYEFEGDNLKVVNKYYLGDQETLKAKIESVKNQTK